MHYNKSSTVMRKLSITGLGDAVEFAACDDRPTHYLMVHVHFADQVRRRDINTVASACEDMCGALRTRMAAFLGPSCGGTNECPENRTWRNINYDGDWWCWEFWCGSRMNEPEYISRFVEAMDVDGWFVPTMEQLIAKHGAAHVKR